jgi:hypothetical protein
MLRTLKAGWLDGQGEPPSEVALELAQATLQALLSAHPDILHPPGIFPTLTGNVQAEWDFDDWAVELSFTADGHINGYATKAGWLNGPSESLIERSFKSSSETLVAEIAEEIATWLRSAG